MTFDNRGCYVYRRGDYERHVAREGREDKTAPGLLTSQIYELWRVSVSELWLGVMNTDLGLGNGQRTVSLE